MFLLFVEHGVMLIAMLFTSRTTGCLRASHLWPAEPGRERPSCRSRCGCSQPACGGELILKEIRCDMPF